MGWLAYGAVVLVISLIIGAHLGRFREAYTEMTGMMAGMMMGMLNGFMLGYAAAGVTFSTFWGNLVGITLGLAIGIYYGRTGGLMGIMDGGMGGVMGGSMGAMLAVMLAFPKDAILWTGIFLGVIYIVSMTGLVALIEQSAPEHAAMHRVLPMFTRAVAAEAAEEAQSSARRSQSNQPRKLVNYYALLGVRADADEDAISEAYLQALEYADGAQAERLERAVSVLTDPRRRALYDSKLAEEGGPVARQASPAKAQPAPSKRGYAPVKQR